MTEPLVIEKKCMGCGRGLPIRVFSEAAEFYRTCSPSPPASLPFESFRCRCRTFTVLTVGDLRLVA